MLYSSGTTGRPKGILRPLPEQPPTQQLPMFDFLYKIWQYREGMIYLSPAPLYHRSEEHTSELQSQSNLVCRLLLEKKKKQRHTATILSAVITRCQRRLLHHSRLLISSHTNLPSSFSSLLQRHYQVLSVGRRTHLL